MYRALIVEDENLMRDYLAAKLSELCPMWTAAATAADGLEAVERMAHERFDAVLTDIRMPGMDGLELARYIRHTDADMPILILSGYDEFDYARAAMRLNVFDYLLKPLNEAELSAALTAMAAQVATRQAEGASGMLAFALDGDIAAQANLNGLVNGKPSGLLLFAPAITPDANQRNKLLRQLQAAVQAAFTPLAASLSGCAAALCTATDPLLVETECRAAAEHFSASNQSFRIRCGYAQLDADGLGACKAKAETALRLALALDEPMLSQSLLYGQRQALARLGMMTETLGSALASGALADDRRASLLAALREFPTNAMYTTVWSLLTDCEAHGSLRTAALESATSFAQNAGDAVAAAQGAFSRALDALFARAEESCKPPSALVQQAREFLQLHFAEPISLAALAEQLGITSAYLSSLFHREMGLGYSQYLLQLRMQDAARRLLSDPNAKVYDISIAVGFPSAKHFTHVFGQYYNQSPTEYRERKGQK